eukprot:scpid27098/ scgid32871/ Nose resistant to fluoxetine protein 6
MKFLLLLFGVCWLHTTGAFLAEMFPRDGRKWPYGQPKKLEYRNLVPVSLSDDCLKAINESAFLPGLKHLNHSKLDVMLDSVGKPGAGLLSRNFLWYGSYQQCTELTGTKYCLNTMIVNGDNLGIKPTKAEIGVCIPDICSDDDAINFLWSLEAVVPTRWKKAYAALEVYILAFVEKNATNTVCETEQPLEKHSIAGLVVCSCIIVLLLTGSIVDWYMSQPLPIPSSAGWMKGGRSMFTSQRTATQARNINDGDETDPLIRASPAMGLLSSQVLSYPDRHRDTWYSRALRCFSLQRNVLFVLDPKHNTGTVPCLHGIRVFSMAWIILGHTYLWPQFVGCSNLREMSIMTSQISFQLVLNSTFAVDSFFVLSGMLVMFWTLRHVGNDGGTFSVVKFYAHRFLRLTPAYMFVLMVWTTLAQYWGEVPSWKSNMEDHRMCEQYWWTNLLYINNFYPPHLKGSCLGWTWYLALDMQFYIISPLVIMAAYRFGTVGLSVTVAILMSGSLIATGLIVRIYNFRIDGSQLLINDIFTDEFTNGAMVSTARDSYPSKVFDKPYCRIAPYLVGLCIGFLVRRLPSVSTTTFSKAPARWFALLGWAVALVLLLAPVYGLYGTYRREDQLSSLATIFYYTFSRLSWALGVGWLVLACFAGYGGYINSFFSHGIWLPLSRLTFAAYLTHPIMLYLLFLGLEVPVYYTNVSMVAYYLAALVGSYTAAFVLSVCVEIPFVELEKLLVSR